MEINITSLLNLDHYHLSNSQANLGDNAGQITWNNATRQAQTLPILDTPDKLEAMRDFAYASGGWTQDEIAEWSDNDLNALFIQWVAGDIREAFGDNAPEDWDWQEYEEKAQAGQVSSNIFRADNGEVFFYLGE